MAERSWWSRLGNGLVENLVYLFFCLFAIGVLLHLAAMVLSNGSSGTSEGIALAGGHDPMPWLDRGDSAEWGLQRIGPLVVELGPQARLSIPDPGFGQRVLLFGPPLLGHLIMVVVMFLLWRIAATQRRGDPFIPANGRRLGLMAALIGVYGLAADPVKDLADRALVAGTAAARLVRFDYLPDLRIIGFALLLGALSAIFRRGAVLRRDVEGLV
ncbi:DUF2975 domain-containing protein [Bailinhaonella thermotolerans]|uniref:DUF2975 domain-containing protein n=1 Tax=Bailinhaonella thermotolerans TaxID=1070861 RepID=A0A3A4AXH5_9ACTN|nr:DUF2975 domain-containing protein [Bailinhaonella thermotolerans]RJL30523.1 DUF2975 domain-containing protein [Bailinhaonella thermotolerans]